jgi:prepilin-type N-terminal cleavage/methylation domain-containing protein
MKPGKGFTIVELIVVIVLCAILISTGISFFRLSFNGYIQGQSTIDADWQGRAALNRFVIDVHNLRSVNDIGSATASSFAFTDLYGNAISYQLSATQVLRSGQALADYAQSLSFKYYDIDGNELVSPVTIASIQFITLDLVISRSGTYQFETGATLWNVL